MSINPTTIEKPVVKSSFAHAAFWMLSTNIAVIILGFAEQVLGARWLGPAGKGMLTSIMAYPVLLITIAEMGIRQATVYFIGKKTHTSEQVISAVCVLLVGTSLLGMLICFACFRLFPPKDAHFPVLLMVLAAGTIPLNLAVAYSKGFFLGWEITTKFNLLEGLSQSLRLALLIVFVRFFHWHVDGALTAIFISYGLVAIYAVFQVLCHVRIIWQFDPRLILALVKMGIVYALALFLNMLNYRFGVIMITHWSTLKEVGYYGVGMGIVEQLWLLPNTLGTVVFSRSANSDDPLVFSRKVSQLLRVSFVALLALSGVLMLIVKPFILGLYTQTFAGSIAVIEVMIPGVVIFAIYRILNMDLAGRGKPVLATYAMIPGLIVNIIVGILLIPKYDALGGAIASTISYTLSAIIFLFVYSHEVKIPVREILRYRTSDFAFITDRLRKSS